MLKVKPEQPLMIDFDGLQALGWPYSRTQTRRKEELKIEVSDGDGGTKVIDNPDPFPTAIKLGWHPNSPLVWPYDEVLAYLRRHGFKV